MHILIINDSEDFRLLVAEYIAIEWPDAGIVEWDPLKERKPQADFELGRFDVILLDHILGKADGLEWLKDLKRRPDCPPIVYLTAAGSEDSAVQAVKLGAEGCLRKDDLSQARLAAAVKEAIEQRASRKAATAVPAAGHALPEPISNQDAAFGVTTGGGDSFRGIFIVGYSLIRKLGKGGTATVFLTERWADGIMMVLKVLDAKLCANSRSLRRFIREYGIVSKLSSPYLPKIYDQGFAHDQAYIAMEYFPGGDLKQRMSGPLAPEQAIKIFFEIVKGLHVIHLAGIIHRDLKPANIMFRENDTLALVDFGVAKILDEDSTLTKPDEVLGTPYYMSPEQGRGEALDARTDLYSAGVILYEMLTGEKPFRGKTAADVIVKHVHEAVPPLPERLSNYQPLIDRLMTKQPGDRYKGTGELLYDIVTAFKFR